MMVSSQGRPGAEIGVRGHDDRAIVGSGTQDHLVVGAAQSDSGEWDLPLAGVGGGVLECREDVLTLESRVVLDDLLQP